MTKYHKLRMLFWECMNSLLRFMLLTMKNRILNSVSISIFILVFLSFAGCKNINAFERKTVNFNYVDKIAKELSKQEYFPSLKISNDIKQEQYVQISQDSGRALWLSEDLPFHLEFFHLGYQYNSPIKMNEFRNDYTQEIRFANDLFNYGTLKSQIINKAGTLIGYAGFKLLCQLNKPKQFDEIISYHGDADFMALGMNNIYGAKAQGFLVNPFVPDKMEIGCFREFWIGKPEKNSHQVLIYGLLDSPSVTAALQFIVIPGEITRVKVSGMLYFRKDVESIGIAPISSLYLSGLNLAEKSENYPELHYSDSLLLSDTTNSNIWIPLKNPSKPIILTYRIPNSLVYFGLMQRNRDYAYYQNPWTPFHLMPNIWVVPDTTWKSGNLVLQEFPCDKGNNNNILVFWTPNQKFLKGMSYDFSYVLNWSMKEPESNNFGYVKLYRVEVSEDKKVVTFFVKFDGNELNKLPAVVQLQPLVNIKGNGKLEKPVDVMKDPYDNTWRVVLAVRIENNNTPLIVSCALSNNNKIMTETWRNTWNN